MVNRHVLVQNLSRDSSLPIRARVCASFLCRLRGLTFHRSLAFDEGLLLVHKKDSRLEASIHMLGVPINLAIVWINSRSEVVDLFLARRWRTVHIPSKPACYVLEIAPERLNDFQIGDRIRFEEVDAVV